MELLTRIDYYLLVFLHDFCERWDKYLTSFSKIMSFIGKDGIILFLFALILMLFRNTRKAGICMFGAIGCGAILSNIIVKGMVMRPRPFETFDDIRVWWEKFHIKDYSEYSFPSGHCTAANAFTCGALNASDRDRKYWSLLLPPAMMFARCYLMMHYPSDCIAGILLGFAGGLVSWIITAIIYKILEHWEDDVPLFDFILNWDIVEAIRGPEEDRPKKKRRSSKKRRADDYDDEDEDEDDYDDEDEDEEEEEPRPRRTHSDDGRKIYRAR